MAKKKELSEEEVQKMIPGLYQYVKNTMIDAGANTYQLVLAAQSIAMCITLDAVGTGPGSRDMLTTLLNEFHKVYLEDWENSVENAKKS